MVCIHLSFLHCYHADGSRVNMIFTAVFADNISKTDAARITKLHTQMSHEKSWKSIYFGVKGQGHNVCVASQTERNIVVAAYANHAGFSPALVFALL